MKKFRTGFTVTDLEEVDGRIEVTVMSNTGACSSLEYLIEHGVLESSGQSVKVDDDVTERIYAWASKNGFSG